MSNTLTIWKFHFSIQDDVVIEVPDLLTPLTVQLQNDVPTLWAIVDPNERKVKRRLYIYGTGHTIDPYVKQSVGTIQQNGFVWHIFLGNKE